MSDSVVECVIEWLKGEKVATVTMPRGTRLANKIKKLALESESVDLIINKDGSVLAQIPSSWVKITPTRHLTEEQKAVARERMIELRRKKEDKEKDDE